MRAFIVGIALMAAAALGRAQDVAFVANPGVSESAVTAAEIKNILLGTKTTWSSGPLKLVVQTDGAVHEHVIQQYAQRSPDQFEKYWKKQVFTGKGVMPASAKSDADVIAFVAATTGGFGYVTRAAVTDKVKVLEVK